MPHAFVCRVMHGNGARQTTACRKLHHIRKLRSIPFTPFLPVQEPAVFSRRTSVAWRTREQRSKKFAEQRIQRQAEHYNTTYAKTPYKALPSSLTAAKVLRFSRKGLGFGEGENLFSREKRFSPSPRTLHTLTVKPRVTCSM